MRAITKDQILGSLPALTKADLQALQTVIRGLLGNGAVTPTLEPNNPQVWLFEAMAGTLHLRQSYYPVFIASTVGKTFNKNAPIALDFMADTFKAAMNNKIKAMGLMRYLLGLLVDDLTAKKVPITRGTVVANLVRLSEIFENSYPDYTKYGIADLVLAAALGIGKGRAQSKS